MPWLLVVLMLAVAAWCLAWRTEGAATGARALEKAMTLDDLILDALKGGPSYGLDIAAKVGTRLVYPALRSLERKGRVESYEGEPVEARNGRPRRYYRLARAR